MSVATWSSSQQPTRPLITPPPDRVVGHPPNLGAEPPLDEVADGALFLLSDRQIGARNGRVVFERFARRTGSESGLDDGAEAEVSATFDPVFQTLRFHSLRLRRDGELIDQLQPSRFKVVSAEEGHDAR